MLILSIIVLACSKNDWEKNPYLDTRCTKQNIDNINNQLLPVEVNDTIKYLFAKNNLDDTNLQFYEYNKLYDKRLEVGCHQYVNNLIVFIYNLGFFFNENDSLVFNSGRVIIDINISNKPKYSLSYVRGIFVSELRKDKFSYYSDSLKTIIENGCIEVKLGYFDLNIGNEGSKFTRAWLARPEGKDYPSVWVDDITGELIWYTNGFIINKNKANR